MPLLNRIKSHKPSLVGLCLLKRSSLEIKLLQVEKEKAEIEAKYWRERQIQ